MAHDGFISHTSEDDPEAEPARRGLPTWVAPSMPVFILMAVIGYFMFTQDEPPHFQAEPVTPAAIDAGTDSGSSSGAASSGPTPPDAPDQPDTRDLGPARPDVEKQPEPAVEDPDPPIPPPR